MLKLKTNVVERIVLDLNVMILEVIPVVVMVARIARG
jgi:hypothetical protein